MLSKVSINAVLKNIFSDRIFFQESLAWGVFWQPIDQDQVLRTWSEGCQNGLVLNLRLCDVTALQASKLDINIQ